MGLRFLIILIVPVWSTRSSNPLSWGCVHKYHLNDCIYSINCTELTNINVNFDNLNINCGNNIYHNGYSYPPVHITYRRINYNDNENSIIWRNSYSVENAIVELDISHNQFKLQPVFETMINLRRLRISHNRLTVAKLSNNIEYINLREIDYSFNKIMLIEVNNSEYVYDKLKILDLSHNEIDVIPDAVFSSFSQLEHLNISNNHLTDLNVLYFEGLNNLQSLQLDYNDIIDINLSLHRFENLKQLSLKHNRMEWVLKRDFSNLCNLIKLDLSCNDIMSIENEIFDVMTFLSELDLHKNSLEVFDKESFSRTPNLSIINLSENKLKQLPKELFKGKNISSFSVQYNNLEGELISGMFFGLSKIISLDISNQQLTSIEDYAFVGLDKLEILMLNNNKIISLSKKSFRSLQEIKLLNLSNNYIQSIDFEKNDLNNLRYLFLKNNLIEHIEQDQLSHLGRLEFLDLSHNNILRIDNEACKGLRMLENLAISTTVSVTYLHEFKESVLLKNIDISFSRLLVIKNYTFIDVAFVNYINMSHCSIEKLQFNSFSSINNIVSIDLSHNKLTNFLVNGTDLKSLEILLLNNNNLKKISSSCFMNSPNLMKDQISLLYLDISYNSFSTFNFTFFTALSNLRSLNLSGAGTFISFVEIHNTSLTDLEISYAQITNINKLNVSSFKRLKRLVLNNNLIKYIDKDVFFKIIRLQYLDLSYNNINYIQPGAFEKNIHLKTLNLSHNYLFRLHYGSLHGLIRLNIFDLSYNYIERLETGILGEAENLRVLIVDDNRIREINYVNVPKFNSLSKLSIGENPISCKRISLLKQNSYYEITTLKKHIYDENIDGITCNIEHLI